MAQHVGTVVWFNNAKGYGFLRSEGGAEVFCHFTSIVEAGYKSLKEGEQVAFDVEVGTTGKAQATNVEKVARAGRAA